MKKLTLSLQKAKEFKDSLEFTIDTINKKIQTGNLNEKLDLEELENSKWTASSLLIEVNFLMQKANLKRISIFKSLSNTHTIKKLSELTRELKHLNTIQLPTEKESSKKNKKSTLPKFKSHISQENITTRTRILQNQITILQKNLTKFNNKNKIKIKLSKDIQKVLDFININQHN